MGEEVVVLDTRVSMFGMRVRIALAEKGVQYEYKEQDLQNKSQMLLQMNPIHKKIPVLIHNGKPICESIIIVEYIDEVWKDKAPLLSSDPYQRAQDRFWTDFIDKKVYDDGKRIWTKKGNEIEVAKKDFINTLKQLEERLGEKPYFGGDKFEFVDLALIPYYTWFYAYEVIGNFKVEAECPKFIAWAERCKQIENVSKSLADEKVVYDFVVALRKRFGLE
ncbi:hypothetical protein TanjilG_24376 [Lupinus angustifolius]|uniref:Glutathione S-transferase n=1 Tax=Lupinus angustifolius TaxID=3871 RepID=A0A1J7I297_LUPAN|nr:PREDICTED: probable glutathione S-transferase [Lupinus angustifolius]XP_019449258.1 PREDICTED: probable glutathione S-transferase [Lupinus angustifolius]OIW08181.1 hypothetical protein TanjilG_24376 [Lupinus angustifolius]